MLPYIDDTDEDLSVTGATPELAATDGGYTITLTGRFARTPCAIVVRDVENVIEYPCYGAVSGMGYSPIPQSGEMLRFSTPLVPAGGPHDVSVQQLVRGVLQQAALSWAVAFQAPCWESGVFDLRRILPPWYRMGPRNLDSVDFLEPADLPMTHRLTRDTFIADGIDDTFTATKNIDGSTLMAYWDGVAQPNTFLTLIGQDQVQFGGVPVAGTEVKLHYWAAG